MIYRFGEFELSEDEFSLTQQGARILLEPRALRVLLVLVASPGRLLDKKAILDAVWKDTFVEETTLTRAVALIRRQLGDDPRSPSYIQTVPTRGYRFIAPVTTGSAPNTATPHSSHTPGVSVPNAIPPGPPSNVGHEALISTPTPTPTPAPASTSPTLATTSPPRRNHRLFFAAGAVGLAAVAFAFLLGLPSHGASSLSTRDTLVIAGFTNNTGDPVFQDALRQGMIVQLEQSPVLRLAGEEQVQNTLRLMGLPPDAPLTSATGREVCQRIGGTVVLNGSISRLGDAFVLALHATRCSTGEQLDAQQVQIAHKEGALQALDQMSTHLRKRIGETKSSIDDYNAPLAEATTSSLDALKAFSLALRTFNARGSAVALPLFQHAADLDPGFAAAHVWLGRMYADVGQEALAVDSTRRAYALRNRSSERERFSIDVSYDLLVTGDLEKARATCEAWTALYPRDVYPRGFLAAVVYPAYGQYERALDEARQSIAIDPDFVVGYRNAATNLIALHRLADAEATLQQASQRKVFLPSFITDSYRIAFLKGDRDGMKQALAAAPRNPWLLFYGSATLAQAGQLREAQALQDDALRLTQQASRHEMEAELLIAPAMTDILYGFPKRGADRARAALHLSTSRDVEASAALVLAMAGSASEALTLVDDLRGRFPEDTLLRYNRLPTVRAAIALAQNDPHRALEVLEATSQFGVSLPLYPTYLRGEAYLALGQPASAAAEFQKITTHPGLVLNDPLLNLAEIHLARAYTRTGATGDARTCYTAVRQRWSSAETFPALQQLQLETAHL